MTTDDVKRAQALGRKLQAQAAVDKARARGVSVQVGGAPVSDQLVEKYLRRGVNVGALGVQLGLDTIEGIVSAVVVDTGGGHGAQLEPGTAVVEIRGDCSLELVREVIDQHRPVAVLVVPIIRPARRRDRLRAWLRWHWWRIWRDPR